MLRKLVVLSCLLLSVFSAGAIEAVLSHSVFFLPDAIYPGNFNPYIEASWQMNPHTIHFVHGEKGIISQVKTDVLITGDGGKVLKEDHYVFQTRPCANVDEVAALNILELKRYLAVPGTVHISLRLTDMNDTLSKITLQDSAVIAKPGQAPFFSDAQLIDTFYVSDVRSPFRKHGNQFIPMCAPFFDDYKKSLSYYVEDYNIDKISADSYPLIRTVFISKKQYDAPYTKFLVNDTLRQGSDSGYFYGTYDLSSLASGNYHLSVEITDRYHKVLSRTSTFFQRANFHTVKDELAVTKQEVNDTGMENVTFVNLNKTFVAKYDLKQVRAILKMLIPVSDAQGQQAIADFLKKPDELYMRYFVYNYFAAINKKDPGKAWKDFTVRIKEVNKLFNTGSIPGYETDRGIMYLRYGAPTDIITVDNEAGALPYEIWQYNNLKEKSGKMATDARMLFYRSSEMSFDYRLLTTNFMGEVRNFSWRSFLYPNGRNNNNMSSRAEEYFGNDIR